MLRSRSYHLDLPFNYTDTDNNSTVLNSLRVISDVINKLTLFFFPIFLFELGRNSQYMLQLHVSDLQRGMIFLGFFFVLLKIVSLLFTLPVGSWLVKNNSQNALIYSYICRICSFSILYFFQDQVVALGLAVVFESLHGILFWNSYNTIINQRPIKTAENKAINLSQFFIHMLLAIAPMLGGLVATVFGLNSIFLLGIIACLCGFIAALHIQHQQQNNKKSDFKKWLAEYLKQANLLKQATVYARDSIVFVWPLHLFILFGTVARVGYMYALSLFFVIVATMFVSIGYEKKAKQKAYVFSFISSLIWVARLKIVGVFSLILVDAVEIFLYNSRLLPLRLESETRSQNIWTSTIYPYMVTSLIGVIFWFLFCALFYIANGWDVLFLIAAVSTMFATLLKSNYKTTIALK